MSALLERIEEKKEEVITSADQDFIRLSQGYVRALRDVLDISLEATE